MSERDRKFLRAQLATIGIFLGDDPKPVAAQAQVAVVAPEPEVDRDEIRAVLVELGAPAKDLDWLVASCPGLEYALTYKPPTRTAWCAVCDGPQQCDDNGCVACGASHERRR